MTLTDEPGTILRLLLAMVLGYIIGLERRLHGQPAGERTHAIVALGSAGFTVLSFVAFPGGDTARVASGVVQGLGFLGAGMILKEPGRKIQGLTTAAGIWTVGAMGMAIGAGMYALGIAMAVMTWVVLISEAIFHLDEKIALRQERLREERKERRKTQRLTQRLEYEEKQKKKD